MAIRPGRLARPMPRVRPRTSPASPELAPPAPLIFHEHEWESTLRDEVLRVISRLGDRELGLTSVHRKLCDGLLEGTLVASDLTMTPLSRMDWERRTVHAMHDP